MLDDLIAKEEGKTLEFKETANALHRILQTIVAFANTAGGTLVVGIKDKTKEVVGLSDILKQEERISSALADSVTPLLSPNFQFFTWRGRDVLLISVAHQPVPYFIKSQGITKGTYVRLGSTNRVADKATIGEIRRLAQHESFDELPNLNADLDDVDIKLGQKLFSPVSKKFNKQKALSLDIYKTYHSKEYPSNGGLLLFCGDPTRFFPNAVIRCGRFAGTTKTKILDQADIELPLPLAIDEILSFIDKHTYVRSEIGRKERVDIPQYPPNVVREAVINAVVHADYSVKGVNIQVAIFSDRIEIINPGALPFGLSLERALSGISQLRNRVIGQAFKELGLIERWGSGLTRMIDICVEQGISKPKFEEQDHFFRVTLFHEKTVPEITIGWKKELVDYLRQNKSITVAKAGELWAVTKRTASSRLVKLRQEGMVTEVGTGPYDPQKKYLLTHVLANENS